MNYRTYIYLVVTLILCNLLISRGWAQQPADLAQAGRTLAGKWQNSVITIEVVVKMQISMLGQEQHEESKSEAAGTIIDPYRLTVTSLTMLDPMGGLIADIAQALPAGEDGQKAKASSEITAVKMLLPDGTILPAQIVLRDKDLDLIFIRPLKKPINRSRRST